MSQLQSLALGVRLTVTNPVSESTSAFSASACASTDR